MCFREEFKEKYWKWFEDVNLELVLDVDVWVKFVMVFYLDGLYRLVFKVKDEIRVVMNEFFLVI